MQHHRARESSGQSWAGVVGRVQRYSKGLYMQVMVELEMEAGKGSRLLPNITENCSCLDSGTNAAVGMNMVGASSQLIFAVPQN